MRTRVHSTILGALAILAATSARAEAASCPAAALFKSDATRAVADVGWTGVGHALSLGEWALGFELADCSTTATGACGDCRVAAAVPQQTLRRCRTASWVSCETDADCEKAGLGGPCSSYIGPPTPSSGSGTGRCIVSQLGGELSGVVNVSRGQLRLQVPLAATLYRGPNDHPCPRCVGDASPNDGRRDGMCDGGARAKQACDANALSSIAAFGATSLDCPPDAAGGVRLVSPSAPVALTTDLERLALKSDSPTARAIGFRTQKSVCDVCADDTSKACHSSAECASGVCGATEGRPPAPNACDDGVCTATAQGGECRSGPFEGRCAPTEPFRTCESDTDCRVAGDVCQAQARSCFALAGRVGDEVAVATAADATRHQVAHPTTGTLFCAPASGSTQLDESFGLPGLIRLQIPGTLTFGAAAGDLR